MYFKLAYPYLERAAQSIYPRRCAAVIMRQEHGATNYGI